jgi:hypothetical protein
MKHTWTRDDQSWLRANYDEYTAAECAEALGFSVTAVQNKAHELGLRKSREWIAERARLRTSSDPRCRRTQFNAGQTPWNRGTNWTAGGRSAETRFKPGAMTGAARANYLPVGTVRIADGQLQRKVTDDPSLYPARRWVAVQRLVWEAAHGPIAAGKTVAFRPGMKTTVEAEITLDRLELVSRADLMHRNTIRRPAAAGHQARGVPHMKNTMQDLRDHLFMTLEDLTAPDAKRTMPIERAKAIAEVAQVLINSAKAETEFLRVAAEVKITPRGQFFPALEPIEHTPDPVTPTPRRQSHAPF